MAGGRPKGIWSPEIVRRRIRTTKLAERLQDHALGLVEMSSTQIKAAIALLKKTVPDLSAVEHSGSIARKSAREMTMAELDERIARAAAREEAQAPGPDEPVGIH